MKKTFLPITAFSFMIAVFAPLDIYFSNKGYFFFEGNVLLGWMACAFITSCILCFLVLCVSNKFGQKFFDVIWGMFFGGTLGLYLQGNWDLTDYGAWNGDDIDWNLFKTQFLIWTIIWILLIVGMLLLSIRRQQLFSKITKYVSLFLIILMIYTMVVLYFQNKGFTKTEEFVATTEGELQLSYNQNMLIIVVDTYDGEAFSRLIEDRAEKMSIFDGFTFFPDTVGGYTSTDMSIPLIATGVGYDNSITYGDYLNSAYDESVLMKYLKSEEWINYIYTDMLLPQNNDDIVNSKKMKRIPVDNKEIALDIYKIVAFRYLPQPLKKLFVFYVDEMKTNNSKLNSAEYEAFTEDNQLFREKIEQLSVCEDRNVFQLVHIDGCHPPFYYDSTMMISDEETSYEEECEGLLVVFEELFQKLKKEGIYDSTSIVIMGDHGYYDYRQNPLLLVKGFGEHHNLEISESAISYFDLQPGFVKLLEKENAEDSFENSSYNGLTRVIRSVPWNTHLNYDNCGGLMKEYSLEGTVMEPLSYGFDGKIFEPAIEDSMK